MSFCFDRSGTGPSEPHIQPDICCFTVKERRFLTYLPFPSDLNLSFCNSKSTLNLNLSMNSSGGLHMGRALILITVFISLSLLVTYYWWKPKISVINSFCDRCPSFILICWHNHFELNDCVKMTSIATPSPIGHTQPTATTTAGSVIEHDLFWSIDACMVKSVKSNTEPLWSADVHSAGWQVHDSPGNVQMWGCHLPLSLLIRLILALWNSYSMAGKALK